MAGLGLMNRRRAIASSPSRINPLEGVEFHDALKGDGASFIRIPNFILEGYDSIEVMYDATYLSQHQFLYGARTPAKSVLLMLSNENMKRFYYSWLTSNTDSIDCAINVYGSKKIFLTDVGYSTVAGTTRRRIYVDGQGQYTLPIGASSDVMEQDLFVFGSNKTDGTMDSRVFQGSVYSFVVRDYDGNSKLDLRPCSYNGEAGMFDMVGMKFYGNMGSGNFTLI